MSSEKKTNLWQEEKEVWRVPSNRCLLLILFWFSNIQRYNYCCPQIVVDFTATWCGPCRLMAPVFSDLSKKYDILIFLKVDVDEVQVRFFFFLNFLFFNIHDHRQAGIALLTLISTMTSSSPQPLLLLLLLLLLLFSRTSFFFVTLWHEDWNNFTHPTFGSALLQGSSDQREPNASETCASDSYILDAHSLLPLPLPSSVFCKVHQIKKIQMLLRHVHQILTSCCLFLQSLLDRIFLITTTIFCSLQHESESNASLRHVHQILTCLFLPSLLNHMLVTTAIFWCPIAKTYARMLSYFF